MVALDNAAFVGGPVRLPRLTLSRLALPASIALLSICLVLGVLVLRGFSDNSFRLGSQLAWRYAAIVFFVALTGGPACRITARFVRAFKVPPHLSRGLVWGFCVSYGVYLLSVFLPNVIHPSAGATLMVLLGGLVALVMALSVTPSVRPNDRPIMKKVRRAMLVSTTGYFWLCYAVMALARISGPHRPDAFYDISLSLMLIGLLVRYADRWLSDFPRVAPPEQTVSNLRQLSVPN
jgi:hypothetical protein